MLTKLLPRVRGRGKGGGVVEGKMGRTEVWKVNSVIGGEGKPEHTIYREIYIDTRVFD